MFIRLATGVGENWKMCLLLDPRLRHRVELWHLGLLSFDHQQVWKEKQFCYSG